MKTKQSGMTLIGFLIMLIGVAFLGYTLLKLVPSYIEFMGVTRAMTQIATDGGESRSIEDIRGSLLRKMDFQYVDNATVKAKDITIERSNNAAVLSVKYDKLIPFVYNIDFLLHFEKSVVLQGNVGQ
jgi:Tfp pilus assembly major pilin PilA